MPLEKVWFSRRARRWDVDENGRFSWTAKIEIWDWDNCTVSLARTLKDKKLIVVVRSNDTKISRYKGKKPVELRFMNGFDVTKVLEPKTESYTARENIPEKKEGPKKRLVFQLDDDYWIWEWVEDGVDMRFTNTYGLYQLISKEISHPNLSLSDNIFDVELESNKDRVVPVIYQPAVDALDNFVREVHCAESPANGDGLYEVEVTIIFNDEQLRRHMELNSIYRVIRRLLYGRTLDIETFKILVRKDVSNNRLVFEKIYSGDNKIEEDDIHEDQPPAPKHKIRYYFIDTYHPVVFINTSNHAMAEHDANHDIWKWEYVPWLSNVPIKFGNKTRKKIERGFKPWFRFW